MTFNCSLKYWEHLCFHSNADAGFYISVSMDGLGLRSVASPSRSPSVSGVSRGGGGPGAPPLVTGRLHDVVWVTWLSQVSNKTQVIDHRTDWKFLFLHSFTLVCFSCCLFFLKSASFRDVTFNQLTAKYRKGFVFVLCHKYLSLILNCLELIICALKTTFCS